MAHEAGLIATVAAAFGLALILGFLAAKVRMPPLIGYLLAGIAELLRRDDAGEVFMGEHELAAGMTRYILGRLI